MKGRTKEKPTIVALIPARSGSKRVLDKNIRSLAGHPIIAYTIASALQSEVFDDVVVSTDSERYANISRYYGAHVPFLRPSNLSNDFSPDIEWVEYILDKLKSGGQNYDCFSILRPTSPFRQAETIQRAFKEFIQEEGVDSLRAVEKCRQHPGKMWIIEGKGMVPLLQNGPSKQPWHSSPYQSLPEVYVQNASLEIAWTRVVFEYGTIAGNVILPFLTRGFEGFDINTPEDWQLAELFVKQRLANLPDIKLEK